jgi:hypothetical protein
MLQKKDVIVGKFYVNHGRRIAREVLQTSGKIITFNNYHLDTGNSCGSPSECTVQDFMRWAIDEASPAELSFLQDRPSDPQSYAA